MLCNNRRAVSSSMGMGATPERWPIQWTCLLPSPSRAPWWWMLPIPSWVLSWLQTKTPRNPSIISRVVSHRVNTPFWLTNSKRCSSNCSSSRHLLVNSSTRCNSRLEATTLLVKINRTVSRILCISLKVNVQARTKEWLMTEKESLNKDSSPGKIQIRMRIFQLTQMLILFFWMEAMWAQPITLFIIKIKTAKSWTVVITFPHNNSMPWKCRNRCSSSSYPWKIKAYTVVSWRMCHRMDLSLGKTQPPHQEEHLKSLARVWTFIRHKVPVMQVVEMEHLK